MSNVNVDEIIEHQLNANMLAMPYDVYSQLFDSICELGDERDQLKAENAKLRELCRDMHRAICCLVVLGDDYAGEHEDELCALDDRMSELGVEV